LAITLAKQGQLDEAAQRFEAALRIDPNFADAHAGLARVLATQKKPEEANAPLSGGAEDSQGAAKDRDLSRRKVVNLGMPQREMGSSMQTVIPPSAITITANLPSA
jgi:thioredoxin-like negative regulator of GroEL